jgi:hypothetical protein
MRIMRLMWPQYAGRYPQPARIVGTPCTNGHSERYNWPPWQLCIYSWLQYSETNTAYFACKRTRGACFADEAECGHLSVSFARLPWKKERTISWWRNPVVCTSLKITASRAQAWSVCELPHSATSICLSCDRSAATVPVLAHYLRCRQVETNITHQWAHYGGTGSVSRRAKQDHSWIWWVGCT